jgi:hypothetical protein
MKIAKIRQLFARTPPKTLLWVDRFSFFYAFVTDCLNNPPPGHPLFDNYPVDFLFGPYGIVDIVAVVFVADCL